MSVLQSGRETATWVSFTNSTDTAVAYSQKVTPAKARRAHPAMAPMMMPPSFNLLTWSVCANPTKRCMVRRDECVGQPPGLSPPRYLPHSCRTVAARLGGTKGPSQSGRQRKRDSATGASCGLRRRRRRQRSERCGSGSNRQRGRTHLRSCGLFGDPLPAQSAPVSIRGPFLVPAYGCTLTPSVHDPDDRRRPSD